MVAGPAAELGRLVETLRRQASMLSLRPELPAGEPREIELALRGLSGAAPLPA